MPRPCGRLAGNQGGIEWAEVVLQVDRAPIEAHFLVGGVAYWQGYSTFPIREVDFGLVSHAVNGGQAVAAPEALADARRRRADRARQVADILRPQVLQGSFAGGVLPGEASLAQEFGASRNAIRDALRILRAEGLVDRVQGVGTKVTARKYPTAWTAGRLGRDAA